MKSQQNIIIKHANGREYNLHNLGFWISRFHIHSPNLSRLTRITRTRTTIKSTEHRERTIEVSGYIETEYMQHFEQQKEQLYTIFATDEEFEIIREARPDRRIFAVMDGSYDIENITSTDGEFSISLTMYDPFLYSHPKTLDVTNEFQHFEIDGVREMNWVSTTRFPVPQSSFTIENNRGGKIILAYSFIAGDVLEIDHLKRRILLNGINIATALRMESNWADFFLNPGTESVKATQPTQIQYAEKYFY